MKLLLTPGHVEVVPQDRHPLLPLSKTQSSNTTTLSIFFGALSVLGAGSMEGPFLRIYVKDMYGNIMDAMQETPDAIIQEKGVIWFGSRWNMQSPLEKLAEGSMVVIELFRHSFQLGKAECIGWTLMNLDDPNVLTSSVNAQPMQLDMYDPPATPEVESPNEWCRMPGNAALQIELMLGSRNR